MKRIGKYFYSGATVRGSAISRVRFSLRVPKYPCEVCESDKGAAYHLGYPQLKIASSLTKAEVAILKRGAKSLDRQDDQDTVGLVARLRSLVPGPIGPGAYFGPIGIAVTSLPKFDFEILMVSMDVFLRRSALEGLRRNGVSLDYVECPASGKHAQNADFVQLVVPAVGCSIMATGYSACPKCYRTYGTSIVQGFVPRLDLRDVVQEFDVLKTLIGGDLVFSDRLVAAVRDLGLRGLDEGSMLHEFSM
ncbi:MAG: hypothetical protein J0L84_11480 [Verrucomicrobia bacterium]|nr:hypothetical protein [Verrucomicrobiota bacterium]